MELRLYNTLTRQLEVFEPQDPDRVTMYVCGPTVYNYVHIGNARPYVVFGLLANLLRRRYGRLVYARNITDVDDKINQAAKEQGVAIGEITGKFAEAFAQDMAGLGIAPPDVSPHATAPIPHIIAMIERLIASGHAYVAEGHVMFHTLSYPDYGQLSKRDEQSLMAGARVEVAPYKKHAGDFVLWKPSSPELPGWDSPWGRGRPGWHIECSAMAEALLGETIDIHGGGIDLAFPHHENERAQSVCAHGGKPFARYWLHNGFLTMDSEKMSKSLGNVLLVREILKHAPGEAIRLALLTGHYRQPLDWNDEALADARRKLDRLYGALRDVAGVTAVKEPAPQAFVAALEDDLNTPAALAELFELARALNKADGEQEQARIKGQLLAAGALLGLLQADPAVWFSQATADSNAPEAAEIEAQIAARQAAKQAKNYAEADRIRDALKARGVLIEDSAQGTRWRVVG